MNLRKEAKGRDCTVQIFQVCDFNPETTVPAHLNVIGWNSKSHALHIAWACVNCHAWLDGGYTQTTTKEVRDLEHLQAIIKTQLILFDEGKAGIFN